MNRKKVLFWMIGIVMAVVLIYVGGLVYGKLTYVETAFSSDAEMGNNSINIACGGFAAEQDDWIYFRNHSDNDYLYKIKNDGTQKTKLIDDRASNINVAGDWIYYINYYYYDRMYKVKADGSERTEVNLDSTYFIMIKGDWIYYVSMGVDISGSDYQLRKMKLDGSGQANLVEINPNKTSFAYINITDDSIYFVLRSDLNWLFKTDLEGKDIKIVNKESTHLVYIEQDWIYYVNGSDDYKLYKMKTDGSNKTKLTEVPVVSYNIKNDWIYYNKAGDARKLCKMKLDGSEDTEIAEIRIQAFCIVGDWIYYSVDKYGTTYRVKLDGTNNEEVK